MKKGILLIISLMSIFALMNNAMAAGGTISVSSSNKTVIVGNTVKVSVRVSSNDLGAWEYCISYDSSMLKLTNSTADAFTCVKTGYVSSSSQKSDTRTFTFKALKSGTTNVTVKSAAIYSFSTEEQMSKNVGSTSIRLMTQSELEATYSTNAYLKSLSVEGAKLDKEFSKDVKEYSVEVENEVDKVRIRAQVADSKSSLSGTGEKTLVEGKNRFEINVTAQKGNELTYIVNVYRKELNPIEVKVDGKDYKIVRREEELPEYSTYSKTEINYDDENKVPALTSEITGYTLLGLKDETGKVHTFIYENEIRDEYIESKADGKTLYLSELVEDEQFKEYKIYDVNFNGKDTKGYKISESSKQAIIYAQDIETGDYNYYQVDLDDGTASIYRSDIEKHFEEKTKKLSYVIYGEAGLVLLVVLLLVFKGSGKKKKI